MPGACYQLLLTKNDVRLESHILTPGRYELAVVFAEVDGIGSVTLSGLVKRCGAQEHPVMISPADIVDLMRTRGVTLLE